MSKLAIIIPYYKLTFFRECLTSLAAQTDQRFTVYIGNDASPENPDELLKEFEAKLNWVYKKFDDNLGGTSLTKQWERCIGLMADEEWFMILGDDDVVGHKMVETFHKNRSAFVNDFNVVRYASQVIDDKSNTISEIFYQPKLETAINAYYRKHTGENRGSLSEFIFRASAYNHFKFRDFDLAWSADDIAVLEISAGKSIYSINDEVVYFRKSQLNITGQDHNHERKNAALLQSTKFLLTNYLNLLNKPQKILFVKLYDYLLLGSSKIKISDFFYLQYLTIRFVGFHLLINQWKTVIHRLIK